VDTEAAALAWIEAWDRAWRAKDPIALAEVYAQDAAFRSHPSRPHQAPVDYARAAFAEEGDELELWWGSPIVSGERAAVEWWAVLSENGELVTLAGASILEFDAESRVQDQHDYWTRTPGRLEPWPGWGAASSTA
jgi:hypothetical protein